jgi:hypothetical protein
MVFWGGRDDRVAESTGNYVKSQATRIIGLT